MGAWHDGVNIVFEVALDSNPLDTPIWTDLSDRLTHDVSTFRGRQDEESEFAPGEMTVTLRNDDRHLDPDYAAGPYFGKLLPMRRARLTVSGVVAATVITGFVQGWPQEWGHRSSVVPLEIVDATALPANRPLANSAFEVEVVKDAPSHYWPMSDTDVIRDRVGGIDLPFLGRTFIDTVQGSVSISASVADIKYPVGDAGGTWAESRTTTPVAVLPRTVEAWVRLTDPTATGVIRIGADPIAAGGFQHQFQIDLQSGAFDSTLRVNYENPPANLRFSTATATGIKLTPGRTHHLVVTASVTTLTIYLDGVPAFTGALIAGTVPFGGDPTTMWLNPGVSGNINDLPRFGHVVTYDTALSAARVAAHYRAGVSAYGHPEGDTGGGRIGRVLDEIGWPASLRNISPGDTIHGPYLPTGQDAVEYLRQIERAEQGLLFFDLLGRLTFRDRTWLLTAAESGVTLSDSGAGGTVEYAAGNPDSASVRTVRNIVTATYAATGGVTQRDATSIASFGDRHEVLDTPTLPDPTTAQNLAAFVLRNRKDATSRFPAVEIDLRATAQGTTSQATAVLGLDIGSVITLQRTPLSIGAQISKKAMVAGIGHNISPEQWTVTLYLSPALTTAVDAPYFTVAHVTRGRVGTPAGNRIPY
jgi:hypothetical protein